MTTKYVAVHKNHCTTRGGVLLIDKIISTLYVITLNIDDNNLYSFSQDLIGILKRNVGINDALYDISNLHIVRALCHFFTYLPIQFIQYYECIDAATYDCAHTHFMPMDTWLTELNEIIMHLEYIVDSFDYNYDYMRESGRKLYQEILGYVGHPDRIMRMALIYDIEWNEYLDAIDI